MTDTTPAAIAALCERLDRIATNLNTVRADATFSDVADVRQAAAMILALGGVEGPASSVDFQQTRGRDADIIAEAISEYENWMLDDDYEAGNCLMKIMQRMKARADMTDRSALLSEAMLRQAAQTLIDHCIGEIEAGRAGQGETAFFGPDVPDPIEWRHILDRLRALSALAAPAMGE